MPEYDILNPDVQWRADLDDAIGPDYGWEQMRDSQLAVAKPAFGRPWSRVAGVPVHSTQFSWLRRSRLCAEYLTRWAQQHERGFFTIIDHDGGGRHYVGNFTGQLKVSQAGNDLYNLQGWMFEEIPGCAMLAYPDQWDTWAVTEYPVDDYGDQATATYSAQAAWAQPAAVADRTGVLRAPRQLVLAGAVVSAGDWAQHEYVGYGCRLYLHKGPTSCTVQILLDGVVVADNVCLTTAADQGPQMVWGSAAIPLGVHRVKVVVIAPPTGTIVLPSGQALGVTWDRLEVMR